MNKSAGSFSTPQALPEWIVECLSRLFSSISDHTRIRIVHALTEADRLNVSEIAEHTGLSISAVSHQLRLLRDRAMLQATREGRSVYYRLADEHLRTLIRTGVQHAYQDCTNNLRRQAEAESAEDG
jgi:DNA-binding transcriptional ArsR family regulator